MSSVLNTAVTTGPGFVQQVNSIRDVYSAEIWLAAMPVTKWDQFSTKKTELGHQPGHTIVMNKLGNIKRGGRLKEGVRMVTQAMSMTQAQISVYENGNAIGFSELLLNTAFLDQLAAASILLGRDLAIVLDLELRDAALGAINTVFGGSKTNRGALVAGDTFDTKVVKDAVEVLEGLNAPKWGGDHYIAFIHPTQARGMRDDNDWIMASHYNNGEGSVYTGEIGRYEDVRFISTTVMPNGRNSTVDPSTGEYVDVGYNPNLANGVNGNQTTIYQAVIFGQYAYAHATALPVELRDNGVEDFGREHGIGWYSIWGSGILESQSIVVAETAGSS